MFRRQVFLENPRLGFPDSEIEDIRFVDLLIGKSTLSNFREKTYKHLLIEQKFHSPIFIYVRLQNTPTSAHVWSSFNCQKFSHEVSPKEFLDEETTQFYLQFAETEETHSASSPASKENELEYLAIQKEAKEKTELSTQTNAIVLLLNVKK